ncbi:MAG: ABC transporter permease [Opitutae bacterium]|nr:ABC transporter permease [Opitutae bacterium]
MRLFLLGILSGWSEVLAHKLRSFLTMTGIVLGAAALVGMLGVVKGLLSGWEAMIYETGGIERISVTSQAPPERQRDYAALSPGRTLRDVEAIRAAVPLARRVTAEVMIHNARLYHQGRATWQHIRGVMPETFVMDRFKVAQGRLIGEVDNERQNQVVVIGARIAEQLFARGLDPLGRILTINGQPFTVVGILHEYDFGGAGGAGNRYNLKNLAVFIPLATAQTLYRIDENIDVLNVQLADVADIHHALQQLTNVLLHTHRGVNDFRLETREDLLNRFEETRRSYVFSLGGVAAIGLLVGGIGIMNVMLASINERVREIGVRRALGAKRANILIQILAESFAISVAGGILGMVASIGLVALLQKIVVPQNRPELSIAALVIGVFFSALVGVVSGLYPAVRASRMNVVEALRSD